MFHIVRYIANKPAEYNGDKLLADGSIQYTRETKSQAEQIMTKLYEISANQKGMTINRKTRYTFKCENRSHKYLFKVVEGDIAKKKVIQETFL